MQKLKELFLQNRWQIVGIYALMLIAEGIQAAMPALLGGAIDAAIAAGQAAVSGGALVLSNVNWMPLVLWLGVDIGETLLNTARYVIDTRVFGAVNVDLMSRVAREQFAANCTDSQAQTRINLASKMTHFFESTVPWIIGCSVSFLGGLWALYALNSAVFWATCVFLVPVAIRGFVLAKRLIPENIKYYDESEKNMDVIKSRDLGQITQHYQELLKINIRISNLHAYSFSVMNILQVTLVAVILYFLGVSPGVTAGAVYAVYAYVLKVTNNVDALPNLITDVMDTMAVIDRLTVTDDANTSDETSSNIVEV